MKILIDPGHGCNTPGKRNVCLVSIHANAAGNGSQWMSARGWCCYTSRGQTAGDKLATCLYQAAELYLPGHRIRKDYSDDDSDFESDFTVLSCTSCATALTESLFYDNPEDLRFLESQYRSAKMISGEQLSLYFGIGCYVSEHSRKDKWGTGAIEAISEQLKKELPGLHGFSAESIKKMRQFYEFWSQFINWSPVATEINRDDFLGISFSHHMEILNKTKHIDTVLFYIHETVMHRWDKYTLREKLKLKIHETQKGIPNNFVQTIPSSRQALQAVKMFKDEYLPDYINLEDIDAADDEDVDERVVENTIVRNVKRFMMTFGKDFAYVGNQYNLEVFGEEQRNDLLFFNRQLNCLVAIELKGGKFKIAYLGQLYGYLQVLDDQVRKPHENPSIGIILCRCANRAFVEYAVRDYTKPMGVATYKMLGDMPEVFREALPDEDELKKLL